MLVSPRKARRLPPDMPGKPRRARRQTPAPAAGDDGGSARLGPPRTEEWPDGDWVVRQVPAAAASKVYRCPGCDQVLTAGTAHVVVWPAETAGPQARRHWHTTCWQRRPRRPGTAPQPSWW
jgi:hypothetical protein